MQECKGCDKPAGESKGHKPRTWCSESCRVRWYEMRRPESSPQCRVHFIYCRRCDNLFTSPRGGRRYCDPCARTRRARATALATYNCLACDKVGTKKRLQGPVPRWCDDCRGKFALRECPECKVTQPIRIQSTYCGPLCARNARRERRRSFPRVQSRTAFRQAVESGDHGRILEAIRTHALESEDCWIWQGSKTPKGYPILNASGRRYQIHRLAIEAKLRAPLGSQQAHHICATPACVNPDHILPVTHVENQVEMRARRSYESRIIELEAALAEINPEHPLLAHVPLAFS